MVILTMDMKNSASAQQIQCMSPQCQLSVVLKKKVKTVSAVELFTMVEKHVHSMIPLLVTLKCVTMASILVKLKEPSSATMQSLETQQKDLPNNASASQSKSHKLNVALVKKELANAKKETYSTVF
jgi:hypothetical protein